VDPRTNPYTPNAGAPPPALVGRDAELEGFEILLERLRRGYAEQSMLITGLRGVGKTVLLNTFEAIAEEAGFRTAKSEITHETEFRPLIARLARRALLAISPVLRPSPFLLSDHTIFVEAGRLVLAGRSPYDPLAWGEVAARTGSPFIAMLNATTGVWPHPPWVAFAFVPFALLPLEAGPWALHAALLAAGLLGAVLLVERVRWTSTAQHALALVLAVSFQPLVIGFHWGQLGPFLLLGFALLVIGLERRSVWLLSAAALLLLLKPHVLVLLALLAAVLVMGNARRAVLPLMAVLAVACGIPLLLFSPAWLAAATAGYAARIDAGAAYATTYALALDLWPAAWPPVAATLVAGAGVTVATGVDAAVPTGVVRTSG